MTILAESRQKERARLAAEIARRIDAGQSKAAIATDLGLTMTCVYRLSPVDPHRAEACRNGARGYNAPVDRGLQAALGKCPRCGRLGIQPCSVCDPNQ